MKMTKLTCHLDGGRMVSLESLNKRTLRNGNEIEITEEQLGSPEIQFLIKRGVLVKSGGDSSDSGEIEAEEKAVLKCTLSPARRLTLDSVKGSLNGGGTIEVKYSDLSNADIRSCLLNGVLENISASQADQAEEIERYEESSQEEVVETENAETVETPEAPEETTEESFEDVTIGEVKESGTIAEQPKSRIDDSMRALFENIGKEILENNTETVEETPEVTPEVSEETKEDPKPVKKGRGRPRKKKVEEDTPKVAKKRGRPRKNPVSEEAPKPKRKRGRPRKNTAK
jgi:hypothetical protein